MSLTVKAVVLTLVFHLAKGLVLLCHVLIARDHAKTLAMVVVKIHVVIIVQVHALAHAKRIAMAHAERIAMAHVNLAVQGGAVINVLKNAKCQLLFKYS